MTKPVPTLLALALASLVLVGCGADSESRTDPESVSTTASSPRRSLDAFCELADAQVAAWDGTGAALGREVSEQQQSAAMIGVANGLAHLFDDMSAVVPPELQADFEVVASAREQGAAGDVPAMMTNQVDDAIGRLDAACAGERE